MNNGEELRHVTRAAEWLRDRLGASADARLAIVLGSGLKGFAGRLEEPLAIGFDEIPGWPVPRVEGHGGALVSGRVDDVRVLCLSGRVHLYEGWQPAEVVRAVRTLRLMGVPRFLLTNAAGGCGDELAAGDLMQISDHLNLTGATPLLGDHEPAFGPRFPDQTEVYAPNLRALMLDCARTVGVSLRSGVYAGLLGPSYETPAEVRMCKTLGADAIGMSTVHEAIALNAMGAELAGLSLVTNLAAGISDTALSHDEVVAAGAQAAASLEALVSEFCRRR